jgi:hypothetical protein
MSMSLRKGASATAAIGRGEFAPGIPIDRQIKPIEKVKQNDPNPTWDLTISKHPAAKRGDHIDLRITDSRDRAHSWALPPELPKPGKNVYAIQQPTHSKEYALKKEPFAIETGYGATKPGAEVEPLFVGKTEVVEAGKDKVRFLRHLGKQTEEFVLRRIDTPDMPAGRMWALHNATKTTATQEGKKIPLYKRPYGQIDPESVKLDDPNEVLTGKIDGAQTTLHLHGKDRFNRVYSYRQPTARPEGVIEHTHKIPDFQKWTSPDSLKGTVLRTELWFKDAEGRPLRATDTGGILNASTPRAREKQDELKAKPQFSVIDVVRFQGKNVEEKPFAEKLRMMKEVVAKVPGLSLPPMAHTPEEKKELFEAIKSGKHPETKEGFVVRNLHSPGDKPVKAVLRPTHDVYVRSVFEKERGAAKGQAGGFEFSWAPDGPVVGRVGTGFDTATRKDMKKNPDNYVGRVAIVRSADVYQNRQDPSQVGALRAPSFQGWHLDKNDPEMMKEAEETAIDAVKGLEQAVPTLDPTVITEATVKAAPAFSKRLRLAMDTAGPLFHNALDKIRQKAKHLPERVPHPHVSIHTHKGSAMKKTAGISSEVFDSTAAAFRKIAADGKD